MHKNFKIIIFTAMSVGLESDNQGWQSSFERHYPAKIVFPLMPKR
jgi:hypothetical protein|tara:strand:+ start:868 stop:1002 length:135 start_codon:yes stop_codon:yes gene_type:complete